MNKLAKALSLRGYFVTENGQQILLSSENHFRDIEDLVEIINQLRLPSIIKDGHISNDGKLSNLEELIWYKAQNHEAGGGRGYRSWKYFIKTILGPKIRTVTLETGVALFVKSLSRAGITTISSCDGHGRRPPCITFFGRYNACWFYVLYNHYITNENLHYDWQLANFHRVDWDLKGLSDSNKWDLNLILVDTYKLANFLLENADYFSKAKRDIFGANRNSTRKLVKDMDFEELYNWMEEKYKIYTIQRTEGY